MRDPGNEVDDLEAGRDAFQKCCRLTIGHCRITLCLFPNESLYMYVLNPFV